MEKPHDPLSPLFLINAYAQGYFPMPEESSGEILWYSPDPRALIPLESGLKISRSLKRVLNKGQFSWTTNKCFRQVMDRCAERVGPDDADGEFSGETWINEAMKAAYGRLHDLGFAHSVEVWNSEGALVGGVYGVAIGGAFFAESMFHRQSNASKVALYHLVERLRAAQFGLLEVQFLTPHLSSLGAIEIPREEYLRKLEHAIKKKNVSRFS